MPVRDVPLPPASRMSHSAQGKLALENSSWTQIWPQGPLDALSVRLTCWERAWGGLADGRSLRLPEMSLQALGATTSLPELGSSWSHFL